MEINERDENLHAFRQRIKNNLNLSKYHPNDLHRANIEDWWLESFLSSRNQDMDVACAVFFECLKWRQNFGIHTIGLLKLRPILERSFIYFHGTDVEENRLLWINFKNYSPNEQQLNEKLLAFWLERHTIDTENQPIAIFLNFHETTTYSMDIHFVKFVFHCLKYFYPQCMRQVYVFDLPLKLSAPWRLICSYLDAQTYSDVVNLTSHNIHLFIPLKFIPKTIGGENDYKFTLDDLARSTGSPLAKLRRFSHPMPTDRKLSNSDKNQLRKRSVKFDINSTMNVEDISIFDRQIDWQYKNFLAISPRRSLILNYDSTGRPPSVSLILQSMSAWYVYYSIGINSRKQVEIVPERGLLSPNERAIINVRAKNIIKSPRKYKIEVLAARVRDVPDNLDAVDVYNELPEDRVKFYYDCFVTVPQRIEKQNESIVEQKVKQSPPSINQSAPILPKGKWNDSQFWPMIIAFDILLVAIVIYIYS